MRKFFLSILLGLMITSIVLFAYPLTIVDDLGRIVTFDAEPNRVVSAAPLITSYLIELGLGSRIMGVTDFDVYYTEAEKIGYLVPLNVEKILTLNPDVVFLFGGFQASEVEKLENAGLKAFVINPRSFEDIFRTIRIFGAIFNIDGKAKKISTELRERLLSIAKKAYKYPLNDRPRVFYASIYPGSKEIWTCGQGSFLNEAIALAGGVNITGGYTGPNGWLTVNPEFIVEANPDIVLVPYFSDSDREKVVDNFKSIEAFKNLKAVKENRIFPIDGNMTSTPGPNLVDLVEKLYELFYEKK